MEAEDAVEYDESEADAEWDSDEGKEQQEEDQQSPYEILGVPEGAPREQIMAAYRELIKQYHEDFQQNRGPKLRELAKRESQRINWAKEEALKHC